MSYKKILIAVDSRENSINIAREGFELADRLQAEVALIFVVDKAKAIGNPDVGIMPNEALMVLKKEAQETLDQLIHLTGRTEPTVNFMPEGLPKDDILHTAEVWGADAIVLGINGKNGFSLWAMGSITNTLFCIQKCPY